MIFLKTITLPKDKSSTYPYCVPSVNDIHRVNFSEITIFAGGNGSGKSTLLNVIAEKLGADKTLGNQGGSFLWFTGRCECKYSLNEDYTLVSPAVCKLIKSEDIMDSIIGVRRGNDKLGKQSAFAEKFADSAADEFGYGEQAGAGKRYEELTASQRFMRSRLSDYNKAQTLDNMKKQEYSNGESAIQYFTGMKKQEYSNGESAIQYFTGTLLEENSLYLLDEPENSLSPFLQFELMKLIEDSARFFGCQFIVATHSPFLMSLAGARIYDLDTLPVRAKMWYELENMKAYARLFLDNKDVFEL